MITYGRKRTVGLISCAETVHPLKLLQAAQCPSPLGSKRRRVGQGPGQKSATAAPRQTVLALARTCRECGMRLGPLEAAMHKCDEALQWTCAAEQLAEWHGTRLV